MVWVLLLCHRMSYPTCDILYAAKGGKKMGTMYLKTRYNCYAGRYAKSLDAVRRAEKRDCLKTLAKHTLPQYVVSKAYITAISTTFCSILLP